MGQRGKHNRRHFLRKSFLLAGGVIAARAGFASTKKPYAMTVTGRVDTTSLGHVLPHEHILVDFIGAEEINPPRWNRDDVVKKMLPYLQEAGNAGCNTLVDCTPNYLGRDVALLKRLSDLSGLLIITNTGYYGGSDHRFLPPHALSETAESLAARWIREWDEGIDGTPIRPGFIKISVNPSHLSEVSLKLIYAAAKTHLKTGLTIASHTGPAVPAFGQIEVLKENRIDPSAFIWVHAQNESEKEQYVKAVRDGAWVSLDGLKDDNVNEYADTLTFLKSGKCLHRILISHDAGWYDPAKADGGEIRGYTTLFRKLIPALEQNGFDESEILQLIRENPANAFAIRVRKLKGRKL